MLGSLHILPRGLPVWSSMTLLLLLLLAVSVTADEAYNNISAEDEEAFLASKATISIALNVDKAVTGDNYTNFIQNIRSALPQFIFAGLPVLKAKESQPVSWLNVHLTARGRSITLRIDQRSLYLRGYSRNNDTVSWEFLESSLIPHSRYLRFFGSYAGGLIHSAGVALENLTLGFSPLREAVITLADIADPTSEKPERTARPLLVLTQIISEAVRIELIASHIAQYWLKPRPLTSEMIVVENSWHTFSSAVQRTDPDASDLTPMPNYSPNQPDISTIGQARVVFGILIRLLTRTNQTSTVYADGADLNRTLANVEYLRVNHIDGQKSGRVYGTVKVRDCWEEHILYDRNSSSYESKKLGESVTLTGPSATIRGDDAFVISIRLSDQSHNDEVASADIVWDPRKENMDFNNYEKHLQTVLTGKLGNVTVGYSVMREALAATIDVVMIKTDSKSPANLYGMIGASQVLGGSSSMITLFNKSSKEDVPVRSKKSIPLARKVVAASVKSSLTIAANLWDHGTSSADNQIAAGSVQFIVDRDLGLQTKIITGKYGKVQVSIYYD